MVKSIISIIIASVLVIGLGVFENLYLNKTFKELDKSFQIVEEKLITQTCTKADVLTAQDIWIDKKRNLHAFIPHTEIKEVDLWVSECVFYAEDDDFAEALAKVMVVRELFEQIPRNFLIKFENLF